MNVTLFWVILVWSVQAGITVIQIVGIINVKAIITPQENNLNLVRMRQPLSRKVEKMKLTLTEEQIKQMYEDSYLDIELEDRAKLYFEFNADKTFSYGEIYNPKINGKSNGYSFDEKDLKKLIPTKPGDPSWHHEWPTCPSCGTYMIYNFECCPKCGQTLLWKEFTGDR